MQVDPRAPELVTDDFVAMMNATHGAVPRHRTRTGDRARAADLHVLCGRARTPFEESFTAKEHGSGIGLALSYRIITRQHGHIRAGQRPEGGSRFGFTLPLA